MLCYHLSQTEPPPLLSSADLGLDTEDGENASSISVHLTYLYLVCLHMLSDARG